MLVQSVWLLVVAALAESVTIVKEVSLGELAELHCPSNDDVHRFQFWQLQRENTVIGPTNKYNREKYKYDVLTGTLLIKGISSNENGLYTCVCKHIDNNSYYSETVELIVKRDWEEVYETDPYTNALRVTLLVALLLVVIAAVFYTYSIKSDRQTRFSALGDDESLDEEAGPSYRPQGSSLDSHGLDTELPKPSIFTDIRLKDSRM